MCRLLTQTGLKIQHITASYFAVQRSLCPSCTSTLYPVELYSLGRMKSIPVRRNTIGSQPFIAFLKRPFCFSHSQRQFIHWPKHWQKMPCLWSPMPSSQRTHHGFQWSKAPRLFTKIQRSFGWIGYIRCFV